MLVNADTKTQIAIDDTNVLYFKFTHEMYYVLLLLLHHEIPHSLGFLLIHYYQYLYSHCLTMRNCMFAKKHKLPPARLIFDRPSI